jgi:hypothetical protein
MQHASVAARYQLVGMAGGALVGYGTTGSIDGALMGASFGQMGGSIAAHFAVACFTAGTPLVVDREGNSRPIDEIEVGDFVLARSEFDPDGPVELKRVEEKFVRTSVVMELVVHGQSIKTTAEHPFYVPAQGKFVAAGELQVGEQLVGHDGKLVQIESIGSTGEVTTVYNLRVADFHTYFVGGTIWGWNVWVHNQYNAKVMSFRARHGIDESVGSKYTVSYARQAGSLTGAFGVSPNLVDDVASVNSRYRVGSALFQKLKQAFGFGGPVLSHAEHASIRRLWLQNGRKPLGEIELFTDRPLCTVPGGCLDNLHRVLGQYGVSRANVIQGNRFGQNIYVGTPNQPFELQL